jgi:hypothetical protein
MLLRILTQPTTTRYLKRYETVKHLPRCVCINTSANSAYFHDCAFQSRKWLNEAFTSMSVNVIEEISKGLKVLEGVGNITDRDSPEEFERVLDTITNYVDNMDISNGVYHVQNNDNIEGIIC